MTLFEDFFAKSSFLEHNHKNYEPEMLGANVTLLNAENSDINDLDVIIIGLGEQRGANKVATSTAPDEIRAALYELYHWHTDIKIGDAGNLILGNNIYDSYQALVTVLYELNEAGKKVIILGGSHDITFAQYKSFAKKQKLAEGIIIDSKLNIAEEEQITDQGFLYKIIADGNNYLKHLTVLGFQSYLVHPKYLQTLDKLRFDCVRLGKVREQLEYYEPTFRGADFVSIDLESLRSSELPYMKSNSPNGFYSDELCQLAKYAGMSDHCEQIGIYGYDPANDVHKTGSRIVAQIIWYFINGLHLHSDEASFDSHSEMETHIVHCDIAELTFKKSLRTHRWWVQLVDGSWLPCAFEDYLEANNNHLPDRWLRANERNV